MTDSTAPIGIFDSGVGGLTVARALLHLLPDERLLYFADTAHCPYGPRPLAELRELALDVTGFLFQQGAKAVIIGSNSSDTAGLEAARQQCGERVFGIVRPGARAALRASRRRRIGVLATVATVSAAAYSAALRALDPEVEVIEQACPEFVPLVESGRLDTPYTRQVAQGYLACVQEFGADTIVLGCTQYPLLAPLIGEIAGPGVELVDPAIEVAEEVGAALTRGGLLNTGGPGRHRFFASGDPGSLHTVGAAFLGQPITHVECGDIWGEPG